MSYSHTGRAPVILHRSPIDPDSTDWVYFVYDEWLRADEVIDTHSALIVGGTIVINSSYLGAMTDQDGTAYTEVYAVQFKPLATSNEVQITHRKSTSTLGTTSLARLDIDHTVLIPVETL